VGHGLAVIAMQSGVALHLLDKDVIDRDAARRALQAIRGTSRESLESLRAELSRLTPSASASTAPRRGLADLDVLLERVRAGGLSVDLRNGHDSVPQEVDETAYVIVQEALTNVLRHASAGRAVVELRREDGVLLVSVRDDGEGAAVVEGFGITGMRSRVTRLGGTLHVGRTPQGFEVLAELPLKESP
jgi:signal transduction histidine kinase